MRSSLLLAVLLVVAAGCDSAPIEPPAAQASPLEGAWELPFSHERVASVNVPYADVEFYALDVGDAGLVTARRGQAVSTCDGRGGCGPVCQTIELDAIGVADGETVSFAPARVIEHDPDVSVGTATLSARLVAPDSLRVRLVVESTLAGCAFDGEATLARRAG